MTAFGRSTLALSVVLGIVILAPRAHASPVYEGFTFHTTAITHNAPELSAAIAAWGAYSAITDGGPGGDVTVTYLSLRSAAGMAAFSPVHCDIYIDPRYRGDLSVLAHELGHCLGLGHFGDGIMNAYGGTNPNVFSSDDILAIETLYPRRWTRIYMVEIAK